MGTSAALVVLVALAALAALVVLAALVALAGLVVLVALVGMAALAGLVGWWRWRGESRVHPAGWERQQVAAQSATSRRGPV